jgi:hypothetical protein
MKNTLLSVGVLVSIILPSVALAGKDKTPPVIASHPDVVVMVNGITSAAVTYTVPTATDNVDHTVAVSCTPVSGSVFPLGKTTVTCTAHDAAGNIATPTTFRVIVDDDTPPVISVSHISSSNTNHAQAVAGDTVTLSFTTNENIYTPVILVSSHTLFMSSTGSETTWQGSYAVQAKDPLGNVAYLITVMDKAKNISACSNIHLPFVGYCPPSDASVVTIAKVTPVDTTPPVIAAHANVVAEATSAAGATVSYTSPTATDNANNTIAVDCAPASGSTFPVGSTAITCTAQDAAGNTATPTNFQVIVHDTTAPVIAAASNVVAEATGPTGAVVTFVPPTSSDAVDGTAPAACLPASGAAFALGSTLVTCTAQDAAGNNATAVSFTVNVVDTTAPTMDPHQNISVLSTNPSGATVTFSSPTTTDSVSGTLVPSCSPASDTFFATGSTTVTCSAQDAAGNTATTTFVVGVTLAIGLPVTIASQPDESTFCPDWRACYTGDTAQVLIPLGAGSAFEHVTATSITVAKEEGSPFVSQPWGLSIVCFEDAAYAIPCEPAFTTGQTTSTTDGKHWSANFTYNFDVTKFYMLAINDEGWGIGAYGSATQPYWLIKGVTK